MRCNVFGGAGFPIPNGGWALLLVVYVRPRSLSFRDTTPLRDSHAIRLMKLKTICDVTNLFLILQINLPMNGLRRCYRSSLVGPG